MPSIPKIIHQTWKDTQLPDRFAELAESWRRHNPGWEYRLWTDAEMRALVAERRPELLAVFDSYPHDIQRADLGRYVILDSVGGVYADLDCECLRPIEPLLRGAGLAIGLEPDAHVRLEKPVSRGLSRILAPHFMAGRPGHAFWREVFRRIPEARLRADVLDATGPFLLTRVHQDYDGADPVTLLPAAQVAPVTGEECWSGRIHDIEFWEKATRDAYVLHYWDGTWWRPPSQDAGVPPALRHVVSKLPSAPPAWRQDRLPLISCLMVTKGRPDQAKLAIGCFLAQTYPDKELVIVTEQAGAALTEHLAALGSSAIRLLEAEPGLTLGELRNLAIDAAGGELICQWDDDDLSHPARLATQFWVMHRTGSLASFLRRQTLWHPGLRRLGVSGQYCWESSMLAAKSIVPRYPSLRRGEDTPVKDHIIRSVRSVLLDVPHLYVYVAHGRNTFDGGHFEKQWGEATTRFEHDRYDAVLAEIGKRLPVRDYAALPCLRPDIGVRLTGLMTAAFGLGTAARATELALRAVQVPVMVADAADPAGEDAAPDIAVDLLQINPDQLLAAVAQGRLRPRGRVIGYWAWETARGLPQNVRAAHDLVDEVWSISSFTTAALAAASPVPVVTMPLAVAPPPPSLDRVGLGLPADAFLFLFIFDGLSNFTRKNPLGLIAAYKQAFPQPSETVGLVIKAKQLSADEAARLTAAVADRPDIRLIGGTLEPERLSSLTAACDCLVSLHRAEGFGLTIAEAMYFAKPVIVTAYSGNMDFTLPETAYLVPYRLTRLDSADGYYEPGTEWAEPDLDEAARLMAHVVAHPEAAAATGARAAAWIRTHLSPVAVGTRMLERLRRRPAPRPAPAIREADSQADVLVLTPVKDAARHLERYVALLERLDYPASRLAVALLEGDSRDDSHRMLTRLLPRLGVRCARAEIYRHDLGTTLPGARWQPEIQRRRRAAIAKARNRLLAQALRGERWVLWLDADLQDYPPDLLTGLLAAGKDIVVPHCIMPDGTTFDRNTFILTAGEDDPATLVDGVFCPPVGHRRAYLSDCDGPLVPVDAVGGTALLISADLHRDGLVFPAMPYRGYIETEGLAMMARDLGHRCWGLPRLTIVHPAE